ncbi:hypothetical protein GCM10027273_27270 [Nocardioides pakistanensis]
MEAAERAGDLLRLAIATVLFTLTVLAIQRDRLSLFERDVFRLVNDLPPWLLSPVHLVEQLGGRWTPLAVGVLVVLVLGRIRLGLSIAAAGIAAWLTAQLLKLLIERPRPAEFLGDLPREWSSGGPGFVSGHTAVATAMAAAAAPYLSRPWRRLVWTLAALVGFARIYSGVHLPLDVVGGAAGRMVRGHRRTPAGGDQPRASDAGGGRRDPDSVGGARRARRVARGVRRGLAPVSGSAPPPVGGCSSRSWTPTRGATTCCCGRCACSPRPNAGRSRRWCRSRRPPTTRPP